MGVGREWEQESHSHTPLLQRASVDGVMFLPLAVCRCLQCIVSWVWSYKTGSVVELTCMCNSSLTVLVTDLAYNDSSLVVGFKTRRQCISEDKGANTCSQWKSNVWFGIFWFILFLIHSYQHIVLLWYLMCLLFIDVFFLCVYFFTICFLLVIYIVHILMAWNLFWSMNYSVFIWSNFYLPFIYFVLICFFCVPFSEWLLGKRW